MQLELFFEEPKAPKGYKTELKKDCLTPNVCDSCDARKYCIENKDNWCKNNSCMSYSREDKKSVFFKKII